MDQRLLGNLLYTGNRLNLKRNAWHKARWIGILRQYNIIDIDSQFERRALTVIQGEFLPISCVLMCVPLYRWCISRSSIGLSGIPSCRDVGCLSHGFTYALTRASWLRAVSQASVIVLLEFSQIFNIQWCIRKMGTSSQLKSVLIIRKWG